ncbi:MAG: hypothetical protein ACXWLR_02655 [Myxococcales bacterium]
MARLDPSILDPEELPEPGPELEARLAGIEQRVRESLASASSPGVLVRMRDALFLIACVRELLRDRDALLEEIDALECGAARPRAP